MGRKTTVWIFQATNKQDLKTWTWLRKRKYKREIESLLITQSNTITTNYVKAKVRGLLNVLS